MAKKQQQPKLDANGERKQRSQFGEAWHRMKKDKGAMLGLAVVSILVLVAILISRLGAKFGVPAMLLFLLIGMAAGPDGFGVEIKNHELAEFLGHLGITFILLSGGLRTSLAETRPVMARGLMLSTVGLAVTTVATGFFIFWALGARIGGAGLTESEKDGE